MPLLFTYLLEVSACLIIFYAFYYFVLKGMISFQYNRFYFLSIYFLSFLIPAVSLKVFPVFVEKIIGVGIQSTGINLEPTNSSLVELNLVSILVCIYLIVAGIFLLRLIFNIAKIMKKAQLGIASKNDEYILVASEDNMHTYTFFKYLFVPQSRQIDDKILAHELVHINQRHSIDIVIAEVVKSILWFNPISYWMHDQIKLNHEFICDASAAIKSSPFNYAQFLSQSVVSQQQLKLVSHFSYKIKSRIIMLEKSLHTEDNKWRYLMVIPLIGILTFFFSCDKYLVEKEPKIEQDSNASGLKMTVTDTITIFNPDTGKEEIEIVKKEVDAMERTDTIVTFDYETYEEHYQVVKSLVPAESSVNQNLYEASKEEKREQNKTYGTDTLTVFDSDTYEETVTIVERSNPCYTFLWGNYSFAGSTEMKLETIQNFIFEGASVFTAGRRDECDEVDTYSLRIVIVPLGEDPKVWNMKKKRNKISQSELTQQYLKSGTTIYIEDILVNTDFEVPGVVIKIK